ncbi:zinc-ribbon domain-containing protein [Methanobrevibacter olleyae]|uniref:EF-hand domain-containing protein n=1 Tax=Methanobrevibacter olleyae TaxID=294671 RepID=A0A126QYR4_METOL|nr:zinc-ribbon domain-containing protein [Methanobrevibacter olleyae]AMK15290.1 hypothetical protein YLM1_0733 [Methanobrevibacter olleyae]
MTKFCSECGFENKDGAQFCKKCGSSLQSTINTVNNNEKPKSNKNTLIICATVIICLIIIAGAFIFLNSDSNIINIGFNVDSDDNSSVATVHENVKYGVSFDEACSYFLDASTTVVGHVFNESDTDGDGYLSDSEYNNFKNLVSFTKKYAYDISNNDQVSTPDLWNGDGTTKTRYCADHGRIVVGSDNRCPYCQQKGLDSRTRSGSTKYV